MPADDLRATLENADIEELSDDDVELIGESSAESRDRAIDLPAEFDSLVDTGDEPATEDGPAQTAAEPQLSELSPPELAADLDDLSSVESPNPWGADAEMAALAAAASEEVDEPEPDDGALAAMADEMGLETDPPPAEYASARAAPAAPAAPSEPPPDEGPELQVADELAPNEEGQLELGAVSALKVLFGCALSKANGVARFRDARGTIRLHYRQGIIQAFRTTIPELAVGVSLEETKRALADLVGWSAGTCHFIEGRAPEASAALGLDRFKPLEEAVRQGLDTQQLTEKLQRLMNRSLIVSRPGQPGFEQLRLYPSEHAALTRLDGEKTLQELLEELGESAELQSAALRAVYLGIESDLVQIGPGPVARAQLRRAQEIENEASQLRQKRNFFDVLGVRPESSDAEVKQRYLEILDLYTRDTAAKEHPQLTEARAKVSDLLEKAFTALATREKRERGAAVVARINPVSQGSAPARTPSIAPAAKAQSSVELFEEAEAAARKANYALSLQKIDEAIDARPDRLQYRLYKEYYKALSDKYDRITAASNAIKEIEKLVGDNEKVVDAHLLMGRLYKFARKKAEAGEAFERVLALEPDNVEAQTEVRIKTNRASISAPKGPTRAESAISFLKNLVNKEEDDPKKKKKKKPPPT